MFGKRENIRFVDFDSIVVILILLFGVLVYNNSGRNITGHSRKPVSNLISVSENTAISGTFVRVQVFQKTWILNKDNFDILAFNRNPLSENKKATLKISNLETIRRSSRKISQFLIRLYLFPAETDDPPLLS
jgi:hypothetical protein